MDFDQVYNDLKNKKYKPIYFLMGEETFFIDQLTDYISNNILTDTEKSYDQIIVYGQDIDVNALIIAARRYPMVAKYQVVIVKEAQNIRDIEKLVLYSENPLLSTILVLSYKYKTLDKRKKLYSSLQKNSVILNSEKLYDDKIPLWATNYLKKHGYSIKPEAALLISDSLGSDLGKIVNELDKMMLTLVNKDKIILSDDIEKYIGISKDFNNFELQKALSARDVIKSNRIINYFEKNPKDNPLVLTISSLFSYFSKILTYHYLKDKSKGNVASALKINPYFVNEYEMASKRFNVQKLVYIISVLREYDAKSKGVGNVSVTDGDLLKELVFKIIH